MNEPIRYFVSLLLQAAALSGGALAAAESPLFSTRDTIPPSALQRGLDALTPEARARALAALAGRPKADLASLRVSPQGLLFYQCVRGPLANEPSTESPRTAIRAASTTVPAYHSKPSAPNIIYLDFDGGVVTGRAWNSSPNDTSWTCKPFDRDGNPASFSDSEQAFIREVWSRVAEDYAPFNVDVTTESPTLPYTNQTAWALITPDLDATGRALPHEGSGGVAFLGIFGTTNNQIGSPAWVWSGDSGTPASHIAEASAHEVGHNLDLVHDGRPSDPAPYGPGGYSVGFAQTGSAPSWGPIMGAPYGRNLTQWSKGDYHNASTEDSGGAPIANTQDDLAVITSKLSVITVPSRHTVGTATPVTMSNGAFTEQGIITTTGRADFYAVTWPADGDFEARAEPFRAAAGTAGGNLDILLELLDSTGTTVLASADDPVALGATVTSVGLLAGNYLLKISPAAKGTPFSATTPDGYTNYGVLGAYRLTGAPGPKLSMADDSAGGVGPVLVGENASRTVTFTNSGTGSLTITAFTPTTLSAPFTLTGVPVVLPTLTAGQSFSVGVNFAPTATGFNQRSISVDSDVGGEVIASISGTGTVAAPPVVEEPPPPAESSEDTDSGGDKGGGCGAGTGIAAILALLILRLAGQRLARPMR